jgi:OHCU decarboxylase
MRLSEFNSLPEEETEAELRTCCGSTAWARSVALHRPFDSIEHVISAADEIWRNLSPDDWMEAFASHPQIGATGTAHRWSTQEQAGVLTATDVTLESLAARNREYIGKFGFIYIVCATGKSADEMLGLIEQRLGNDRDSEIRIATGEQSKITELRLRKLLSI